MKSNGNFIESMSLDKQIEAKITGITSNQEASALLQKWWSENKDIISLVENISPTPRFISEYIKHR